MVLIETSPLVPAPKQPLRWTPLYSGQNDRSHWCPLKIGSNVLVVYLYVVYIYIQTIP